MNIVINEGMLSDLFFNHEHPNWDAVMGSEDDGNIPEYAKIIRPDAQAFAAIIGHQVDVEWLVQDFVRRV